jgi:DNA-binding IclR family transcriptional regulator
MSAHGATPPPSMAARIARVLRAFDADAPVLNLGELAERTELASSTVHRIARALAAEGLLDRVGDGYAVGLGLWEIGELAPVSARLREVALPHLLTLYEETRENVHLAVLDGAEALYVGRIAGTGSIPTLSRMGGRHPLHATGVGKALLATRDEMWLATYFRTPRERETVHTVTVEARLREQLAETRARGWAIARQEMTLGNVSVAAALPASEGIPPTAVGVVAHTTRAAEERLGRSVARAAAAISEALASH